VALLPGARDLRRVWTIRRCRRARAAGWLALGVCSQQARGRARQDDLVPNNVLVCAETEECA
jgi:hypothetical protein